MKTYVNTPRSEWAALVARSLPDDTAIEDRVRGILARVKEGGDKALRDITIEIDGCAPDTFLVSREEVEAAVAKVSSKVKAAVAEADERISAFHKLQIPRDAISEVGGVRCVRKYLPIEKVGLYIPGGSAPLFSTILMLALPAKIAGCREITLCTPCGKDGSVAPEILYTAFFCGIDKIYKLGGAQAIGAMAYGTETVPKVSKIFGPGNRYVMKAKQLVSSEGTAIDMPAGPSEVMVLADKTACPEFVAADLLSQAEHGPDSQVMLVATDESIASAVESEVARQLALLPRGGIAEKALQNSRIIVFDNEDDIVAFANEYAAEHLIISMEEPWKIAGRITAAGSIFIGNYSPESAGDYASGTNHTLPTMGLATAFSGIGTDSFMHAVYYQELSREGLSNLADTIIDMAEAEGLQAHAAAVKIRLDK